MSNSTLFIPDISGFTKFIKSTDITHSQHIIEELLNLILKEGAKHFEVAEIEGDAIFFYKKNQKLSVEEVTSISKKIFLSFNEHISKYEHQRICNCGACSTTIDLKLKFIVHSGEITFTKLGTEKPKPFGSDVIILHRLMKNDIPHKEYILFSDSFIGNEPCKMDGEACYKEPDLGDIPYHYLLINKWKEEINTHQLDEVALKSDLEVDVSKEINYSADILHEFISDLRYRHYWNKEADEIIYDEKIINRAGTDHVCIVNGKNLYFEAVKLKVDQHVQAYGEILKKPMAPFKYFEIDFLMIPSNEDSTDFHIKLKASVKWKILLIFKSLFLKKMASQANMMINEIIASVNEHIRDGVIYT